MDAQGQRCRHVQPESVDVKAVRLDAVFGAPGGPAGPTRGVETCGSPIQFSSS
jgi:hypothetical protein